MLGSVGHGRFVLLDPDSRLVGRGVKANKAVDEFGVPAQVGYDILVADSQYAAGVLGFEAAADEDIEDGCPAVDGGLTSCSLGGVDRAAGQRVAADDALVVRLETRRDDRTRVSQQMDHSEIGVGRQ